MERHIRHLAWCLLLCELFFNWNIDVCLAVSFQRFNVVGFWTYHIFWVVSEDHLEVDSFFLMAVEVYWGVAEVYLGVLEINLGLVNARQVSTSRLHP